MDDRQQREESRKREQMRAYAFNLRQDAEGMLALAPSSTSRMASELRRIADELDHLANTGPDAFLP
jgi:hypothetical protein